ncbi:MAG: hypothetical protein U0470_08945 [Anaerolineae bacterium]
MSMLSVWPREPMDGPDDPSLEWIDGWLRADEDVDAPAGFAARAMFRLESEQRRVPHWRLALGTIGMLLSGVLLVSWIASELFAQWHRLLASTPLALIALEAGRGLAVGLLAIGGPGTSLGGRIGLYGMAAVGIALLWFTVTVAPRGMSRRAAARRRP